MGDGPPTVRSANILILENKSKKPLLGATIMVWLATAHAHISNALASGDKSTTGPLSNSQRIDAVIRHHSRQPLICASDNRSISLVQ